MTLNSKPKNISYTKLQKLASESFKNSIRLHLDSIILYKNSSFASAFQLSVLSMEEMAKAKEIENYYFHSKFNKIKISPSEELKWLERFHIHSAKQYSFVARDLFDYSPKYVIGIKKKWLEDKKQKAIYVGFKKIKGKINPNGKISSPLTFKEKDARTQISVLNDELIWLANINLKDSFTFLIDDMNEALNQNLLFLLKSEWKYKSGVRSARWAKYWFNRSKNLDVDLKHITWLSQNNN